MSHVLVTGATGEIARGVLPYLREHFPLRLLALDAPDNRQDYVRADLLDWNALTRAMNGVDAVLHLAVAPGHSGTYEDDAFNDLRFDVNVKGTYHVFECARRARVRRVVYVSSLMAIWGKHIVEKYIDSSAILLESDGPPNPIGTYALTKAIGEQIAEYYGSSYDRSSSTKKNDPHHLRRDRNFPHEVIALRIAGPLDIHAPNLQNKTVRPQQVPTPDLAQAFVKALTVPLSRFEVVTIVGDCSRRIWDLGPAKRVLGYEPDYYLDDLGVAFAPPFGVEPE